MSVPSYFEFIEPLLRVLYDHPDGLKTSDAYEEVADNVGLSAEQRAEMLPSGSQETYKNRIGWAHDRLKRADLSQSAELGVWQLTSKGAQLIEENPEALDDETINRIYRGKTSEASSTLTRDTGDSATEDEQKKTPDERIDAAICELKESVSDELLKLIHNRSAEFFEHLVLDVLQAMGYGTGENSIGHKGASHDGGIDGVISLDQLGLEKIYVQAKRWQNNSVGRPDLQKFYGALSERQASKGVFITTSTFSTAAEEFADSISDSIVLVNGAELTDLMISYGVGIRSERTVEVVDIDRDYFEPE
jgi:restriction system protein